MTFSKGGHGQGKTDNHGAREHAQFIGAGYGHFPVF